MPINLKIIDRIRPYRRSMPDILKYRVFCYVLIYVTVWLLRKLAMLLIQSTGRVAISSGDFDFLFKTWQGPLLIIIGLFILFIYVFADLNVQILYAEKLLKGQPDLFGAIKEAFLAMPRFFTPDGIVIILYISLIAPIVGLGVSITLTESLYIPTFISSVIDSTPLYHALYILFIIVFLFLGVIHIFILHGILIGKLPSNKADDESRAIMKANWKDFLKQNISFFLLGIGINIALLLVTLVAAVLVSALLFGTILKSQRAANAFSLFFLFFYIIQVVTLNSYTQSFYMIRMTQLYFEYKGESLPFVREKKKKGFPIKIIGTALAAVLLLFACFFAVDHFDELFFSEISTGVIAHRAGGIEAPENTIEGLEKAIELGAYGAEIDIQRTSDDHYIVNHDSNFSRLCSNSAKPEDLTLEQVKALKIKDPNFPDQTAEVATFEEMLDAAKGRIVLFVELKGNSANYRMVDDAVKMIKERGMTEQVVLISLKYNLINYAETRYPEIQAAYLTFASFGNTAQLNCDYLGLEEEAATSTVIDSIHKLDRKVLVWTPNESQSQRHFLISEADYIITDKVSDAMKLIEELNHRESIEVFVDMITAIF